jgi:hypothetical protein
MPVGDFYRRPSSSGTEYEVVLVHPEDLAQCRREFDELHIEVRDDATIGHFTIHIDDPLDWAKVGTVVIGEVFSDHGGASDPSAASDADLGRAMLPDDDGPPGHGSEVPSERGR